LTKKAQAIRQNPKKSCELINDEDGVISRRSLIGEICPIPVVRVLEWVEGLKSGERGCFHIDDPLAVKSIPDELIDMEDVGFEIKRMDSYWELNVWRE
jgi:TusA-related sulfurtransferase